MKSIGCLFLIQIYIRQKRKGCSMLENGKTNENRIDTSWLLFMGIFSPCITPLSFRNFCRLGWTVLFSWGFPWRKRYLRFFSWSSCDGIVPVKSLFSFTECNGELKLLKLSKNANKELLKDVLKFRYFRFVKRLHLLYKLPVKQLSS